MRTHESEVCVVGGGISAALVARKLAELRPGLAITVVEAGRRIFDLENRMHYRQRMIEYGENAWPGDFIADQSGAGLISRTMAVGGQALHWGAMTDRFSEEDLRLRSLYGLAADWPMEWAELERAYCEAERRIGVAGEPSPEPEDRRSEPYPMPPMPLTYTLARLKAWAEKSGIRFFALPQAKNTVEGYDGRSICKRCNTCDICPTGARYSPDFTFERLLMQNRITLHDRTLVRKLVLPEGRNTVAAAQAVGPDGQPLEYRARLFVLAAGFAWSPHLLLLSACSRFPRGLANRTGMVGRYMTGHGSVSAEIQVEERLYPAMNVNHALQSRKFFRCPADKTYVRHDLKIMEGRDRRLRLRGEGGRLLLGSELLADWRAQTARGAARLGGYYDVHPDRESRLTLDPASRNRWGDPHPRIEWRLDAATRQREGATRRHFEDLFALMARQGNGVVGPITYAPYLNHTGGGCRMGKDPAESVCDSYGRTHDHENLFVVGAPTLPTAGCTNGTLTFAAVTLRSVDAIAEALGGNRTAARTPAEPAGSADGGQVSGRRS